MPPREWRIYPCHNLPCLLLKYIGLIKHCIGFVQAQPGLDLLIDDQFHARLANLSQTAYSRKQSSPLPDPSPVVERWRAKATGPPSPGRAFSRRARLPSGKPSRPSTIWRAFFSPCSAIDICSVLGPYSSLLLPSNLPPRRIRVQFITIRIPCTYPKGVSRV
jgi:hypothetical protein